MAQNGYEEVAISMSPATSGERFLEAHELIVRAWTEEGPFPFEGKHSRLRYVNVWPRPLQRPHPPVWIPSRGSPETVVQRILAAHARLGFGIMTGLLQFGPLSHELTKRSPKLFARKVMPEFRPL